MREPDQLIFSATIEPLQSPTDGRPGIADGVPENAAEQLGGQEQDTGLIGLRDHDLRDLRGCDLRDRIDAGLMSQSETGLIGQNEIGLSGQSISFRF